MSSNEITPAELVELLFEAYPPLRLPRSIDSGKIERTAWTLFFDPSRGADGFFLTPSDEEDTGERKVQANRSEASAALASSEPSFIAFAKALKLLPPTAKASNESKSRDALIDHMDTELGVISLLRRDDGFQLKLLLRSRGETGRPARRGASFSAPIDHAALASKVMTGTAPLKAACELAPEMIQKLFPEDRALNAEIAKELLRREIPESPSKVTTPKKPNGI